MNQHIQVPKMNLREEGLATIDPYVYACIKRFMNTHTREAFPNKSTLIKVSGLNKRVLLESINRLEKAGYISVDRANGKSNVYKFNAYKQFEIFSYDFLDNHNLTPKEKAYLVASQQFMYKNDSTLTGQISFPTEKFAECIGLSLPTLRKYETSLKEKNILSLIPSKREGSSGLPVDIRSYDFQEMVNIIACKFQEHDKAIEQNSYDIKVLQQTVEELQKKLARYEKLQNTEIIL